MILKKVQHSVRDSNGKSVIHLYLQGKRKATDEEFDLHSVFSSTPDKAEDLVLLVCTMTN